MDISGIVSPVAFFSFASVVSSVVFSELELLHETKRPKANSPINGMVFILKNFYYWEGN
jgi:hypothetical protein